MWGLIRYWRYCGGSFGPLSVHAFTVLERVFALDKGKIARATLIAVRAEFEKSAPDS